MTSSISVIMPTYKHEMFIRRAIASLVEQSFINWELIIINDCSPDNTEDAIQHFLQDERIQYYSNKQNKGLGACLNFGILKAKASYITYL
ncbi:MAG: glycosyl transferase family 2, partial [Segetibacter sp.]|nr:glycosyl transferase family 2 [Segetibacter sp.]